MNRTISSEAAKPTFGGHEKFVFRHGWLKKGVDAVRHDPSIFSDDQSLVLLGVGKNMVRSIRHWCIATNMIEPAGMSGRTTLFKPTDLANRLLADRGWDPFSEDPGTLWLLHWRLVSNQTRGLVWHIAFSSFYENEFTKLQLASYIGRQFEKLGLATTSAMIEREIDTCLHTYVPTTRVNKDDSVSEDTLDCPLAELDLLRFVREDNIYQFNVGPKPTLSALIFGYALLGYWPEIAQSRQTAAVEDCIYRAGSPGQAFKLDENSVVEYLEEIEELTDGLLRLQETAGIRQIYLSDVQPEELQVTALNLLESYYGRHRT